MTRVLILRSPGTNCDEETAFAFRLAGAETDSLHVGALLRRERRLDEWDLLAFSGGFSYGDDLGAGTVLASRLETHLAEDLREFVASGRLVIGICNGFQVLVRLGLLPGWGGEKAVSLVENTSGKFEARWVRLRIDSTKCPFLSAPGGDSEPTEDTPGAAREGPRLGRGAFIRLPVAHREGRFVVRDNGVLERLRAEGQIAVRYVGDGQEEGYAEAFPWNPNGSVEGIAGITNPAGNVLGLMPHPERHIRTLQDPTWTRSRQASSALRPEGLADGFGLFLNALRHLELRKSL